MASSRGRFRITGGDVWVLFFVAGVAAGTIAANQIGEEARAQAGYFARFLVSDFALSSDKRAGLWKMVLGQRLLEVGVAALIGATPFAVPGFLALGGMGGFVLSTLVSILTYQKGLWGLPIYLASWFPHGLFYLAVWTILVSRAMDSGRERHDLKLQVLRWMVLGSLLLVGSLLEAYAGPFVLRWALGAMPPGI